MPTIGRISNRSYPASSAIWPKNNNNNNISGTPAKNWRTLLEQSFTAHMPFLIATRHPFNGPLSRTTQMSRYQKGKTNLDLLEQETVSGSGISWVSWALEFAFFAVCQAIGHYLSESKTCHYMLARKFVICWPIFKFFCCETCFKDSTTTYCYPRQITMPVLFTGQMPFLPPNQQHQSTEGN